VLAIGSSVESITTYIFLKETNPVIILERKAARLRKETGNMKLKSALEPPVSGKQLLILSLKRPFVLLFISPIVLSLSVLMGVNYAYLYLCFTTFPIVFQRVYGFSEGTSGLAYLGLGIGSLIGLMIVGRFSDRIVVSMTLRNGVRKPEYRLPFMIFAHLFIPLGLFWYGWAADKQAPWYVRLMNFQLTPRIVPIIGSGVFSAGVLGTFMPITTYLIDAFQIYAASALAANTVLRSVLGALLPLAGPSMVSLLG
jgi:Major Facilitator Superfamily